MNKKILFSVLALGGVWDATRALDAKINLRIWLLEMHAKQIELLKIDWGQPGLCTEWDSDYNRNTRSCGRRGKLTDRSLPK